MIREFDPLEEWHGKYPNAEEIEIISVSFPYWGESRVEIKVRTSGYKNHPFTMSREQWETLIRNQPELISRVRETKHLVACAQMSLSRDILSLFRAELVGRELLY